jgi:peptidoglycan/LPS O-acetylase OafA/YrhL
MCKKEEKLIKSEVLMGNNMRYGALDGARGLAALGVIIFHSGFSHWAPWYWGSMDFFFVMSGLLITRTLIRHQSQREGISKFYWYRVTRLAPVLATTIFAYELTANFVLDSYIGWQSLPYLLFYQNTDLLIYGEEILPRIPYLNHFWSLIIEEQYYLAWGILFFYTSVKQLRMTGWTLTALCLLLLIPTAFRAAGIHYWTLPARYDGFFLGSILGLAIFLRKDTLDLLFKYRLVNLIVLIVLVLCTYRLAGSIYLSYTDIKAYRLESTFWLDSLCYSLVSCAFLVYLLMFPASWLAQLLTSRPLKWLGIISYEMYVIHVPVILILRRFLNIYFKHSSLFLLLMTLAVTLPLAYIAHNQLTLRCLKNRDVGYEIITRFFKTLKASKV